MAFRTVTTQKVPCRLSGGDDGDETSFMGNAFEAGLMGML
jgi:hypothetical protein